ncbi:GIN domain-containing protein [Microbacter margulisiae]|uniref:Putative auto-transporter adhesin head GIN domain-containing protein n=1 Tax=Microbacter margulisiae TaxID=1350067 RepID=A0A7W5DUA0_9PORP|nr:DUF2807 domain-containing protein [Microbacter margulisiae]MBB3188338.1 hypothetical protein [Microbacter margulisiae]
MRYLVILTFLLASILHMQAQIVKEVRVNTAGTIHTVKINDVAAVCFLAGSTYKVEIETEKANQPNVTVTETNHQLAIDVTHKLNSKRCIAYITIPNKPVTIIARNVASCYTSPNSTLELDNLQFDARSVASIKMNLISNVFNCTFNAVAYAEMTGSANRCKFDFTSTTDIKMGNFKIKDLDLTAHSGISMSLYVSKQLKSDVNNVMHFDLAGHPLIIN